MTTHSSRDPDQPAGRGPLRLGVLVDTMRPPRWMGLGLQHALSNTTPAGRAAVAPVLAIVGVVEEGPRRQATKAVWSPLRQLYETLDGWRASKLLTILDPVGLVEILAPVAPAPAIRGLVADTTGRLTEDAAALLRAADLDLLLLLSDRLSPSSLAEYARFGAAVFVLSDHARHGEYADGFQEVQSGSGLVGVRLERYCSGATEPSHIVDTVTNAHPYSATLTQANAAWHAIPLLERLVSDLSRSDGAGRDSRMSATLDRLRSARAGIERRRPTILTLTSLALRYARNAARPKSPGDRWEIAYRWGATSEPPGHPERLIAGYARLIPPADRFWADPFPMRIGDRSYVVFEELQYGEKRGYIRAVELGTNGPVGEPVTVLDRSFHLSYPFLFEHEGEQYLLPEMCLEGRLELFRAVRPPFEWALDRVLLEDVYLIDSTIAQIDGRWWLFACRYMPGLREWNDLVLFHSASPFGPWTAHAGNPVVSDVRCARPAGGLYSVNGTWYRPAQDCARTYGGALTIRRITRLTESEYEEEEFLRIDPGGSDDLEGVHTLNRMDNLTLIDVKRRR